MAISRTVSVVELLWTGIALMGVGYSVYGLVDALEDRRALREREVRRASAFVISRMVVRNEGVRLAMLVLFTLAGVASMFLPNDDPLDPPRLLIAGALISGVLGVVWATMADKRDRKILNGPELDRRSTE